MVGSKLFARLLIAAAPLLALVADISIASATAPTQQGISVTGYNFQPSGLPIRSTSLYPTCGTELENNINRNFEGEPFTSCGTDFFMLHYEGFITIPEHSNIKFMVAADDGGIVNIGGYQTGTWNLKGCSWSQIIQPALNSGSQPLDGWFFEWGGGTCFILAWNIDDEGWEIVPEWAFTTEYTAPTTTTSTTAPPETVPVTTATSTTLQETSTTVEPTTTSSTDPVATSSSTTEPPQPTSTSTTPESSTTSTTSTTTTVVEIITTSSAPSQTVPVSLPEPTPLPQSEPTTTESSTTTTVDEPSTSLVVPEPDDSTSTTEPQASSTTVELEQPTSTTQLSTTSSLPPLDQPAESVNSTDESQSTEQVQNLVEEVLSSAPSADRVAALAADPAVIANVTIDQAETLFALLDDADLTEEQVAAITEAMNEAPAEIKQAFEAQVNVFGKGFDDYVPLGSSIPVGARRVLIASSALLSVVPTVRAEGTSRRRKV